MSYFDKVISTITKNSENSHNSIPYGLPKLENYIPGIVKDQYVLVTSNTKVGKSTFIDNCVLYNPYEYAVSNSIKLKIFYWSMEMSLVEVITRGIIRQIFIKYNVTISRNDIFSLSKNRMSQEIFELILSERKYFEVLEDMLVIKEGNINPYGVYKEIDEYCKTTGKYINGKYESDEFVVNIVDHVGLLQTEKGMDKRQTIEKFSSDCISTKNKYGVSHYIVQQQSAEKERSLYTNSGSRIEDKHEPSVDSLRDCKYTSTDCTLMLGIYAPQRYGVTKHNGINITQYGDEYRSLKVMLNRNGESELYVPLLFKGNVGLVREL